MMLRGRHRGLPYALDRAVNLPSDLVTSDDGDEKYRDDDRTEITSEGVKEKSLGMQGRKMMKAMTH
jgi:hypothetical protein